MDLAVRLSVPALCRLTPWLAAKCRLDSVLVGLNLQKSAFDLCRFPVLKYRLFRSKDANLNNH